MRRSTIAFTLVALGACATFGQLAALRRVDFSLDGVQDGRVAGISLNRVSSYRDLSALDVGRLALAVARKDVPLDAQVNVGAANPSDNKVAATMVRLAWTLFLDNKETVSGVLDTAITMPSGVTTIVPLKVRVNLYDFFGGSAQSLLDLAAGLAGLNADPTRITLKATPTINTPIGPITYPQPITIASKTVGGAR